MGGEQDVNPGRVAEIDARHVDDKPDPIAGRECVGQRTLQPGDGVQVDLTLDRHDDAFPLGPACDLKLHQPHITRPSLEPPPVTACCSPAAWRNRRERAKPNPSGSRTVDDMARIIMYIIVAVVALVLLWTLFAAFLHMLMIGFWVVL